MVLPDFPAAFYVVAVIAIIITGVAKGAFGMGSGGVAVPMMSIFIAPTEAAGIMLPILCAMDLFGLHAYRGLWSVKHLRILVPGAVLGIAAGGLAFGLLPVDTIRLLLGFIAISFALNQWLRLTERLAARLARERKPPGRVAGVIWGAASGFTSTLAHAGGPPYAIYMLAQPIDKTILVSTSIAFFLIVNYLKLIPYYFVGQLNTGNLAASLLFAPLVPLGIWLGVYVHRRISQHVFLNVNYSLLFAVGVKLIWDALAH